MYHNIITCGNIFKQHHLTRSLTTSFIKSYHLTGSGTSTTTHMIQSKLSEPIITDVPRAMGGMNKGPQPIEMFLSSLCGCELVTAQFIARNMKPRVIIDRIDFDIRACRDQRGAISLPVGRDMKELPPSRLERIWGTALLHTTASNEEIAFIAEEVKRRCPIANMVILSGCDLDIIYEKSV